MRLFQIAQRMCSNWLTVRAPKEMAEDHQQLLVDAMHRGIGEYFQRVPVRFRSKEYGVRFGAPVNGTATVTNGSDVVTFTGVTPLDGATVILAGDEATNTVKVKQSGAGGYRLTIPYGGTSGTVAATVYRDVAPIPWEFAGFLTRPFDARGQQVEFPEVPAGGWPYPLGLYPRAEGTIYQGYRIEQAGGQSIIRIIPAPGADLPVKMTLDIQNVAISGIAAVMPLASNVDTQANAPLPISDEHCIRFVIPFISEALLTHPLWKDRAQEKTVRESAATARSDMRLIRSRTDSGFQQMDTPFP